MASDANYYIELLLALRLKAKDDHNYTLADRIRTELAKRGVTLRDMPDGVEWVHDPKGGMSSETIS